MIEVVRQIGPKIVIPMHIFSQASLEKFLTRAGGFFAVRRESGPAVVLSRAGACLRPRRSSCSPAGSVLIQL